MRRAFLCAMLLATLASPTVVAAQQDRDDGGARERAFIDLLRREDPASAERFIALRDARDKALAELQHTERLAGAMPPELRASFVPQLKQARRKYVDSQIQILDFLDERDRRLIARLRGDIEQLNRDLEAHQRSRDELRKLVPE